MLNDAQSKAIRVEGWVCWFDRLGRMMCVIYWWDVGLGYFWLSCLFDVRSDWQGIKIRWLSISDFNRRSGSRFAIVACLNCVVD